MPYNLNMDFKKKKLIRKTHRYLGLIMAIQFLMWTISGLYFSWTNIDEIHGDHFKAGHVHTATAGNVPNICNLSTIVNIRSLLRREIGDEPYYWVNDSILIHAISGEQKTEITKEEAISIADAHLVEDMEVREVAYLTQTDGHHEYREKPLPAYAITYEHPSSPTAYVSAKDGRFQAIRHQSWRWFDLLWMTHTMDYESRDNINNWLLRLFSLFGLITVFSGLTLWVVSTRLFMKRG